MINGQVLERREKEELANDVADLLRLPHPYTSTGGSVDGAFLDRAYAALGGIGRGSDTYRKAELLLDRLGLTYDHVWDSSEGANAGGGTVTSRAYSRMRTALSGIPRCFVVALGPDVADAEHVYRFDGSTAGRLAFKDAGPESRIVYYSTVDEAFVATARVRHLAPGWRATSWEAALEDYAVFPVEVPLTQLEMPGYNPRRGITEVTHDTYVALLDSGGVGAAVTPTAPSATSQDGAELAETADSGQDIAERVFSEHPSASVPVSISVPRTLPAGTLPSGPVRQPSYTETATGEVTPADPSLLVPRSINRARDQVAEKRAVELATKALQQDGWKLTKDRQKDGCGYDLEFERSGQVLKVEVKGVVSELLAFNVTTKELWRAETDDRWVVVAVTSILAPVPKVNLVTRDRVVSAKRSITGYRIQL